MRSSRFRPPAAGAAACIACSLAALSGSVLADSPRVDRDAGSIADASRDERESGLREEIEVVPPRRPRVDRSTAAHETTLGPEDLARVASPRLDDALRQVAAFDVFRRSSSRSAHPTTRGVTLRGIGPSGASRALVTLDGLPLNDPFGGWVHFGRVPSTAIASVTVSPGGGSDTRGSAALSGTVEIAARPPEERRLDTAVALGERGERRAALGIGGTLGRASASVDAERIESDGHPLVRVDRRGPIDEPAPSETTALLARVALPLGGGSRALASLEGFDERRGGGTPGTRSRAEGARLALSWTTLGGPGRWDATLWGEAREFATRFTAQAEDRRTERPALDQFDVPAESAGASATWSRDSGTGGVSAGLDARVVNAETNEDFRWLEDATGARFTRRRVAGARASHAGAWAAWSGEASPRWRLEGSLRADAWRTSSGGRSESDLDTGALLVVTSEPDRGAGAVSPRAAASYLAAPGVRVSGAAYGAFRAPTVNELFRPFRVRNDVTEANAALDPERLRGGEAAVSIEKGPVSARAGVFMNRVDDLIANGFVGDGPGAVGPCAFVPAGGVCRQRANIGSARFAGLEADVRARLGGRWRAAVSVLATDAEFTDAPGQPELVGRPVPQVPRVRAAVALDYDAPGRLGLSIAWRGESGRLEDEIASRRLAGYGTVDLAVTRELRPGIRLRAAVGNVFGQDVETARTADGVVSIGAPRIATLALRFGRSARRARQTSSPM